MKEAEVPQFFKATFTREFKHAKMALKQAELMSEMLLEPEELLDLCHSISAIKHILFWRGKDLGKW